MKSMPAGYIIEELRRLDKTYRALLQRSLRDFGVTPGETAVLLFLLVNAPRFDTASDIARSKGLSTARVARSVESLGRRGWISVQRDGRDRRVQHLALSEQSRPAVARMAAVQEKYMRALGRGIAPGELEAAFDVLARLVQNAHALTPEEETPNEP